MLCDKCGKNPATNFYSQTINGRTMSMNLCSKCAKEMALFENAPIDPFGFSTLFSDFLFPYAKAVKKSLGSCSICGKTFDDITADGKAGCYMCYETFMGEFLPSIEKLHGNATHIGKVPRSAGRHLRRKRELESLKAQLDEAIKKEDFENAAVLRDKIKKLTEEDSSKGPNEDRKGDV